MIRLGKQEEIDAYFEREAASQSFLKQLCKGVAYTKRDEKTMYYEEKGHLIIGSAIDDRISLGKTVFEEKYYVSSDNKPSDAIMSMVQQVFDHAVIVTDEIGNVKTLHDWNSAILDSANDHKYQVRWKDETRVSKIQEAGYDYFEELKEAFGKQILSPIENTIVGNIHMAWQSNPYTSEYFASTTKHIYMQVPIYFEFMNIDCKALLDMVIYDPEKNTLQPIDFKTMSESTDMFPKSLRRFGYNFQAAFYTEALKQLVADNVDGADSVRTIRGLEQVTNEDTTVLPFKFMVETTGFKVNKMTEEIQYMQGSPLMYTLSKEQMKMGKYGRPELVVMGSTEITNEPKVHLYPIIHREILGFKQAIDLFIWHSANGWEIDKKVVECGGDILI